MGVEVPSAAVSPCEVEVDAVAAVLVLDGEDLLADVLLVAPCLVCPVVALERVVADEGLLHEDQLPFESSVSRQAGHVLLASQVSTLPLVVGQLDQMAPIIALDTPLALAGPCSSAPVAPPITALTFPEGLVPADDCICGEGGGCRVQLSAVEGERFSAPVE